MADKGFSENKTSVGSWQRRIGLKCRSKNQRSDNTASGDMHDERTDALGKEKLRSVQLDRWFHEGYL